MIKTCVRPRRAAATRPAVLELGRAASATQRGAGGAGRPCLRTQNDVPQSPRDVQSLIAYANGLGAWLVSALRSAGRCVAEWAAWERTRGRSSARELGRAERSACAIFSMLRGTVCYAGGGRTAGMTSKAAGFRTGVTETEFRAQQRVRRYTTLLRSEVSASVGAPCAAGHSCGR